MKKILILLRKIKPAFFFGRKMKMFRKCILRLAVYVFIACLLLTASCLFNGKRNFVFAGQDHGHECWAGVKDNENGGVEQEFNAAGEKKSSDRQVKEEEIANRVILITLDKVTYGDLLNFSGPVLSSLMKKSAVALMNVNTASSPGTESGYLTIGSGSRLSANRMARMAFNREEPWQDSPAEAFYRRHTGKTQAPPGEVLHLYGDVLHRLNEQRLYPALVGTIGDALSKGGQGVAVLGNADGDAHNRQIVTIAMNSEGVVAYGDVGTALLKENGSFPFGKGSDSEAYLRVLESLWKKAAFIAVEWGDTSRVDDYMAHLSFERRGELLQASLQELDRFLLGIEPYLTRGTRLVLLAPSLPNLTYAEGQRLAPVLFYDPVSPGPGLIASETTRQPGLITNIDIAPTVLHILGMDSPVFLFGTPLTVMPVARHLEKLAVLSDHILRIFEQRPAVIKGYLTAQIVLLSGALGGFYFGFKQVKVLQPGLYALLFFPAAALIAPIFPRYPAASLYANVFLLVSLTILLTFLAIRFFSDPLALFSFMGLLIFGLLTVDLLRGAPWISRSFLGYDPVGGARFYGIGNEYMGIMVGAFILGFGSLIALLLSKVKTPKISLLEESKKTSRQAAKIEKTSRVYAGEEREGESKDVSRQTAKAPRIPEGIENEKTFQQKTVVTVMRVFIFSSFLFLFLMASPAYGTNFGGAVTAGVALAVTTGGLLALLEQEGYAVLPFWQKRAGRKKNFVLCFPQKALLFAFFILATGALLYWLNNTTVDTPVSHLGRTLELVRSDGLQELWKIALRKMEMNMKLIRYSLWSRVLFLLIFLVTALYFYPVGLTKKIFLEKPGFKAALGGIIAGSFTSFFVNDSGVVTAATVMLYGGLPLLLLCFKEVFS